MSIARYLRTLILAGLAIGGMALPNPASAFCLTAVTPACANDDPVIYATQSLILSGGAFTIPGPAALNIFFNTSLLAVASATTGSFNVDFTLQGGVAVSGTPTATVTNFGAGTACVVQSALPGTVSGSTISFNIPTTATGAVGNYCRVTLNNLHLTGGTALEVVGPTFAFNFITYRAALSSQTNVTFTGVPFAVTGNVLATSTTGLYAFQHSPNTPGFIPLAIDVNVAGLGQKFRQNGVDSVVGDDGGVSLASVSPALIFLVNSDGVTPFVIGLGAVQLNITGNWNNIASASITPLIPGAPSVSAPCGSSAPTPGTQASTITATTITIPGIILLAAPPSAIGFGEFCLAATGTGLIGSNPGAPGLTATVGPTTQPVPSDFLSPFPFTLLPYVPNGIVQQILVTTNLPGAKPFLRFNNNTGAPASVITLVQPDGGTAAGHATTTVAANSNALVPAASLITASGVTPATGLYSMLILAPGFFCVNNAGGVFCPVSAAQVVQNPGGIFTQIGSGRSP